MWLLGPHYVRDVGNVFFSDECSWSSGRLMADGCGFYPDSGEGKSAYFASPLISQFSYGPKLRLVFQLRPMNSKETVMPPSHNGRRR